MQKPEFEKITGIPNTWVPIPWAMVQEALPRNFDFVAFGNFHNLPFSDIVDRYIPESWMPALSERTGFRPQDFYAMNQTFREWLRSYEESSTD